MWYNTNYEICAVLFLILLMIISSRKQRVGSLGSRAYQVYVTVIFINTCLDIITCYTIKYYQQCPLWVNYLMNTLFLSMQGIIPTIFVSYAHSKVEQVRHTRKLLYKLVFLPAALMIVLMLLNLWNHHMFYFDANGYHHGPWHNLLYVNMILYSAGTIIYALCVYKTIGRGQSMLICTLVGIAILPSIVQFFLPNYMLSGLGTTMSAFVMYLTNENTAIYIDSTTGALNREALAKHFKQLLQSEKQEHIFVVALDNFKIINEIYGMEGGNEMLRMFVAALKREYEENQVYRFGGDIFVVTLPELADCSKERDRIQRILAMDYRLFDASVNLSGCICLIHTKNHEYGNLIWSIDYAVSKAKSIGKNKFFEMDEQASHDMGRRMAIEQAMMESVKSGHFEVHYQPIYDTKAGRIHSMEALARLNVPGYGYVSPEEFIRIAEKNGIILQIGILVLEEVCRFIRQKRIKEYGIEFVEVNLSVVQCMQERIYQEIQDVLHRNHIPPSMINLEITESAAAYSEKQLIRNMARMTLSDITFSLDDYGSGYSNVNYLVDLPFSIVKIDKYIVWAAMKKVSTRKVLENTITMFKDINLKIVAEGIEDREMMDTLISMGTDYLQGYYFSKPVPADKLIELLKEGSLNAKANS